jgi:CHAD domain-containing protein
MAARLKEGESPRKGLRRIVHEQVDKACDDLAGVESPGETVHSVRKRFKRLRALLRLARDGMDEATADRESTRFRDLGRPLSEVRDSAVLVAAFDKLVEQAGGLGRPDVTAAARDVLLARQSEATRRVLGEGSALGDIPAALGEAREALDGRAFDRVRWSELRSGLRRIYRQGRRAFREAAESPTDEALHEWRKRVKDLGYALEVVEPIRPAGLGQRIGRAGELADLLGDDHDLAVLRQIVLGGSMPAVAVTLFLPAIDAHRAELRDAAFSLGRKVYRERPADFADRLDAAWRTWRSRAVAD